MTDEPLLKTDRFELRRPTVTDLDSLCALVEDEETRRFLGPDRSGRQAQFERLLRVAGSWSLYGYGALLVRPAGSNEVIGSCGIFHSWRGFGPELGMDDVAEAGWIIRRDWWGKGVASEVMAAVMAWFDTTHPGKRVACMIEEGNVASQRVAARLGFERYASHVPEEDDPPTLILLERIQ
ncbi:GCN5-related N-acetyltransferase [Novosphingobium sp. Rr 2-17]|uniref:GNAT family N-acetyltransferase n=1 Tax=Novosphingobium sp. Rr 2-17 TaxID=555793 RepID=UPI0002699872|nr:GNAT family N-acetyltransferase [Novosphingobium sp. Rr 2-17]EIZ79047.1 GCN5-related N-acetyltransferase [Novosphingobium sp. Rr 2-17]